MGSLATVFKMSQVQRVMDDTRLRCPFTRQGDSCCLRAWIELEHNWLERAFFGLTVLESDSKGHEPMHNGAFTL